MIFWTPTTGARVVRGPINAAWDKLGGSAGPLGVPVEDEAYRGEVVTQKFTGGELSWNRQTKTFTTVPPELAGQLTGLEVPDNPTSAINAARRAAGGELGPLGAEKGPPYEIGSDGLGQDFAGGKIFYSPSTGAHVVTGQVLAKYESVGGPEGDLGFPTSSETDGGLEPASRMSTFAAEDRPVIFWTPDHGAVIVRGAMNAAWAKLGGATGPLGAPMADQTEDGDVISQRFTGGEISCDSSTNDFTTEPANLASSLSGLEVPGAEQPQAPSTPSAASDTNGTNWFAPQWWWLLILVPVLLLLLGLVFGALWRNRRQGGESVGYEAPDDAELRADAAMPYAPVVAVGHGSAGGQDQNLSAPSAGGWGFRAETPDATTEDRGDRIGEIPDGENDEVASLSFQNDPDAIDTAPTRIELDEPTGAEWDDETALELDEPTRAEWDDETPSGRYAAVEVDDPAAARMAIHLPLDDPYQAPDGYPVKADTQSGLYWTPDSGLYDDTRAEIWFASEEFARTNGFVRAD